MNENNTKLEQKLGFTHIRKAIEELCLCAGGAKFASDMSFMRNFHLIEHQIDLTEEFRIILMGSRNFPSDNYFFLTDELIRLKINGTFIEQGSLSMLAKSLHTIAACISFLRNEKEQYPTLNALCLNVEIEKGLIKRCDSLIDGEGQFYDSASEELKRLRYEHKLKVVGIERRIRRILALSKAEGWSNENAEITIRNGRQVIPVSVANKRRIKGFVQDYSSSGSTSYIEPAEIVEMNNELRKLEFEERKEIIRILTEFSNDLRPLINGLILAYDFLYQIDFIRAKAIYAVKIKAGRPIFDNRQQINWYDARHPLLQASLATAGKNMIPLRIELNEKKRILIISGPNAGGKSVCLKSVGLLQYMLQCGLLVPMRETSETGIFTKLFIDIGDEQSLENDLSTYSSHLLNMKQLCEEADARTLFLIDECGSGTDPQVGGAIAEAIIEDLNRKKAFGVITTHYSNLKLLCDKRENEGTIFNGAMLFDLNEMRPLYVLAVGKPGSSFAFEIAKQTGLPKQIIDKAIEKTGSGIMHFERQLQQLEVEKRDLQRNEEQFKVADALLAETLAKYERLNSDLINRKNEIINQAKQEAKQILEAANQRIEKTIADIRAANAQKETANLAREQIKQEITQIEQEIIDAKTENRAVKHKKNKAKHINEITVRFDTSAIKEGDYVLLESSQSFAQVMRLKRNRAEVTFGNITMSLPLSNLKKVDTKSYLEYKEQKSRSDRRSYHSIMEEINNKRASFKYQIDLRGEKAEQAVILVTKQMDEARLLGESEFAILHGKGDGILKSVIREYLKTCSEVEYFRPAALENGGEGITIVKII